MHIWVNRHWDYINGVLLDNAQSAETIKSIVGYDVSDEDVKKNDWVIVKQPKFWLANTDQNEGKKKTICINTAQLTNDETTNSLKIVDTVSREDMKARKTTTVQYKMKQGCEESRQFISSKRMQKLLK